MNEVSTGTPCRRPTSSSSSTTRARPRSTSRAGRSSTARPRARPTRRSRRSRPARRSPRAASTSSAAAPTRARRPPTSRSAPASPGPAAGSACATRPARSIDSVGWGTATNALVEGAAAAAPPATAAPGSSIVRLPDGHDTNANASDFTVTVVRHAARGEPLRDARGDLRRSRAWAFRSCAATSTSGRSARTSRALLPAASSTSRPPAR